MFKNKKILGSNSLSVRLDGIVLTRARLAGSAPDAFVSPPYPSTLTSLNLNTHRFSKQNCTVWSLRLRRREMGSFPSHHPFHPPLPPLSKLLSPL